ncbi:MAG: YARHG domain-containing protein [Defluviitaleaceae bacterium]|nr:YARHG domain-containing protein [Defluviitaleaceae bacterium]
MFCIHCGKSIKTEDAFCRSCGKPVKKTPKNMFVPVLIGVALVIILGVGGFFAWRLIMPETEPSQRDYAEADEATPALDIAGAHPIDDDGNYEEAESQDSESVDVQADPVYARMVTEDFLSGYISLFIQSPTEYLFGDNIWQVSHRITQIPASPELLAAPYLRSFRGQGDSPALIGSLLLAGYYFLHDLNGDGIPEIFIGFFPMFANGPNNPFEVFVYDNGRFHSAGVLISPTFYTDGDGRTVVMEGGSMPGWDASFSYFDLDGSAMNLEIIRSWDFIPEDWYEIFDWQNPSIPGIPGSYLSLIPREVDMEEQITESLTRRFRDAPPRGPVFDYMLATEGFILPFSGERLLTESDIWGLSVEELSLARNEIYARRGRRFANAELQAHFESMTWYVPTLPLGTDPALTHIERQNVELIQDFERR